MSAKPHQPDPFLCIDGASAAIDFYVSVFGAKLVDRMDGPGGTVAHAELAVRVHPRSVRAALDGMTRVEEVSPEERDRRMAEWAKENVN